MKFVIFILMFFVIGALFIIENNGLVLSKSNNITIFFELYAEWINSLYLNLQILTGRVIQMDWFP